MYVEESSNHIVCGAGSRMSKHHISFFGAGTDDKRISTLGGGEAARMAEVKEHLSPIGPPGRYNRAGRGYPDVAATGQNFAGYVDGDSSLIAGTSVPTPVFASLVTQINSLRLNAGKGPVGFLNPTLYQHPEIFNDIVTGDNPGCGTSGFECVPGWDPITGLGTPNYGLIRDLFLSLP